MSFFYVQMFEFMRFVSVTDRNRLLRVESSARAEHALLAKSGQEKTWH